MGGNRLIQINTNHTSSAQDLLHQVMAERGVDLAIVAEPYRFPPNNTRWAADITKDAVVIIWRQTDMSLPCSFIKTTLPSGGVRQWSGYTSPQGSILTNMSAG